MMSRWSRRSQEEKERIAEKQTDLKIPKAVKEKESSDKRKTEILESGELPLRCSNCGPTTSQQYTLAMANTPMGGKPVQMVSGKCRSCGGHAKTIIEPRVLGLNTSMIVGQIILLLNNKGRIIDNRSEPPGEWK